MRTAVYRGSFLLDHKWNKYLVALIIYHGVNRSIAIFHMKGAENMNERNNNKGKNEPIGDLMKSMNQFFQEKPVKGFLQSMDEFFKNPFPSSTSSFHVNVSETNDEHIISAELPGINKEQIQIDVLDNYVTITVLSTESMTEENEHQKTIKKQTSIKKSIRTVPLPQLINESKVKASYQNGLLQIRVPKQKGKQIMIDHLD